jgi:leader peptidase (prepilin peptidase)/N-methyltransferase
VSDLILPLVVGLALTVLGIPVVRWLGRTTYRRPDEVDEPSPGLRWWVPPALGLSGAFLAHRVWQVEDAAVPGWPVAVVLSAALLAVALACVTMSAIDLDVHRLPDRIMFPAMAALGIGLVLAGLVGGGWEPLVRGLLGALAGGGLYLLIALLSLVRGSLAVGLGDVKLAVLLGGALGWFGWSEVILGIYGGFVVGGLWALVLLALRRVSWAGDFAYGPAMMVGALLGLMWAPQLTTTML